MSSPEPLPNQIAAATVVAVASPGAVLGILAISVGIIVAVVVGMPIVASGGEPQANA
jgi:hypothetical protein